MRINRSLSIKKPRNGPEDEYTIKLSFTSNTLHNFFNSHSMSQPLIFITGATGFIGSHVVSQSLAAGYKVRLSVRKEEQIKTLRKIFSKDLANLDFAIISDFASPKNFSKTLEDVTHIFHLASPMPGKGVDFHKEYLEPAVQGTIALLNAAKKVDTIKRIVIVSSLLAFIPLDALATGKFTAKGKNFP